MNTFCKKKKKILVGVSSGNFGVERSLFCLLALWASGSPFVELEEPVAEGRASAPPAPPRIGASPCCRGSVPRAPPPGRAAGHPRPGPAPGARSRPRGLGATGSRPGGTTPPRPSHPAPPRAAPRRLRSSRLPGAGPWRCCRTCRCRIHGTASSCCSAWGPGPMATSTRCAGRRAGRES